MDEERDTDDAVVQRIHGKLLEEPDHDQRRWRGHGEMIFLCLSLAFFAAVVVYVYTHH